jgi:S-DNA-T family DNA segregation ATPase FtsK/SpoIIIE
MSRPRIDNRKSAIGNHMTSRQHIGRTVGLFLGVSAWVFAFLSMASFRATDWPSHAVYPYGEVQNLCGTAGAAVAYYLSFTFGPGVYPIFFFSAVYLGLKITRSPISDVWLRFVGMVLLSVSFAAAVHQFRAGAPSGLPEGSGGLLGIAAAKFLQQHFSYFGTLLVLLVTFFVGLLLAADDLVLRTPALVGGALQRGKELAPGLKTVIPSISLPKLQMPVKRDVTDLDVADAVVKAKKGEVAAKPIATRPPVLVDLDDDDKGPAILPTSRMQEKQKKSDKSDDASRAAAKSPPAAAPADAQPKTPPPAPTPVSPFEEIVLEYADDKGPADAALADDADPGPAGAAVIPPPEESRVNEPPPPPKRDIVVRLPQMVKPRQTEPPPPKELGEYTLPAWDILAEPERGYTEAQEQMVRAKAAILEQALREFDIDAQVVEIDTGPVITMYEIALAPGIKVSAITALSNDIMRSLKAESVRIVAPVPGKNTVGIEVPNDEKEKVRLKELMQTAPEGAAKFAIPVYLGKDASGEPLIGDITRMPHCLIAGTTGSGKSVCINTIIMSIMYTQRPDRVKLVLVDPKVVEMAPFKEIPHLMCPVINDAAKATSVLEWACTKMDERYDLLAEAGVRNIADYNRMTTEELIERFHPETPEEEAKIPKKLPYIVIIVDELADLMMTSGKEVESSIVRIAQKARAVGIHLVLATQRPQATVVTGLIKANMPSKIAFRVSSKMDSRIVLDMNGAEVLLGQGDMLYLPPGASKPIRGQGTFIDDKEIRESVKLVKGLAEQQFEPELVQIKAPGTVDDEAAKDPLFDDAVRVVLETKRGSVSLLQRRLTIGYSRASRLIEAMAAAGLVGEYKGSQAREATISLEEWDAMKAQQQQDEESGMTV